MQTNGFLPMQYDPRCIVDSIDILKVVTTLLKDSECTDAEQLQKIAENANKLRNSLRGTNLQPLETYKNYIQLCLKLCMALPWGSKKIAKLIGSGFQWVYSRNPKNPMTPENTLMIDVLGCLYNCVVLHSRQAAQIDDLKARAQELAKGTYYAKLASDLSVKYASMLQNVDTHFGQGYFTALSMLTEAQCFETQAILRASRSDLVSDDAAFNQFIGISAYAQQLYRKADGLLLGVPNATLFKTFTSKRLTSITCAMLYVNAAHIASQRPGQALKDAMDAQELVKQCDLLDFGTIQTLITNLMLATSAARCTASPTQTVFTPQPSDISAKYKEWGIEIDTNVTSDMFLVSSDDATILKLVLQEVKTELPLQLTNSPLHDTALKAEQLVNKIQSSQQTGSNEDLLERCRKMNEMPNLRERLIQGTRYDQIIDGVVSQCNQVLQIWTQILMADADNIRRYGQQRWNSMATIQNIQQQVAQLNQTMHVLTNQRVCTDYLKQYNDQEFAELFQFATRVPYIRTDPSLLEELNAKAVLLRDAAQKSSQMMQVDLSLMDVYQMLQNHTLSKKNVKTLAQVVVKEQIQKNSMQCDQGENLNQLYNESNALYERYLQSAPLTADQQARFVQQTQKLSNLVTTLQSGEDYISKTKQILEANKEKATSWLNAYVKTVQEQFPAFQQGAMMNILLQ